MAWGLVAEPTLGSIGKWGWTEAFQSYWFMTRPGIKELMYEIKKALVHLGDTFVDIGVGIFAANT